MPRRPIRYPHRTIVVETTVFSGIQACVFDAYGTLFDVHSAVARLHEKIGPEAAALSMSWRSKQLEYTWLRSLMQAHADFWQVTADALDIAMHMHRIDDPELRAALLQAYLSLSAYDEVRSVLTQLKQTGMTVGILTNGSPDMIHAAVHSAALDELIDHQWSVEAVGVYKPDPRVYRIATEALSLAPASIAFMSSNGWDAAGAAYFGFRVAWVNRFGQPREILPAGPEAEIDSLAELPALLGIC